MDEIELRESKENSWKYFVKAFVEMAMLNDEYKELLIKTITRYPQGLVATKSEILNGEREFKDVHDATVYIACVYNKCKQRVKQK